MEMNLNLKRIPTVEIRKRAAERLRIREENLPESMLAQYSEVPEQYKPVFAKAYTEKGPTAKIKAKCLDCTCFQQSEIKNCECFGCPLWTVRPYR